MDGAGCYGMGKGKNKGNFYLPVGKQTEETTQGYYGWKKSD
jgi:hypothetical protein